MKKAVSLLLALAALLCLCLGLVGCGKDDNSAPSGMKTAAGGDALGYYFYVPEAWTVANQGGIAAATPSKISRTSVTLVRSSLPEGVLGEAMKADKFKSPDKSAISDYLTSLDFPYAVTVTEGLKADEFGNADKAFSFVYEYKQEEMTVRVLQYYVIGGENVFLFTYTSNTAETMSGTQNYDFYLAGVEEMIKAFKLVKSTAQTPAAPEYPKDGDGYILVSDKSVSGFELYIPQGYTVDYSSGAVGAKDGKGASLSVTEISYNALTLEDYVMGRIADMEELFGEVRSLDGKKIESTKDIEADKLTERADLFALFTYEYVYSYRGTEYTVYQAFISPERGSFYAFTLTAPSEGYADYAAQIERMLDKLGF